MVCGEGVFDLFGVYAGLLEGAAPAAVREGQEGGPLHVVEVHLVPGIPGRQRAGGLGGYQVAAEAVHTEVGAEGRDPKQSILVQTDAGKPPPGRYHAGRKLRILARPFRGELPRVRLVAQPAPDDLDPVGGFWISYYLDGDAEAVKELRAELALLRVHRADEDETRGVPHAHTFALNVVHTHRGHVEKEVHEVVGEQIHLVHVQNAPVRRREQTRLEGLPPLRGRLLNNGPPPHPLRAGPPGRLDEPYRPRLSGRTLRVRTRRALGVGIRGVTRIGTTGDDLDPRQQLGQRPYRGGLGRPLLTAHEHAPDLGRDGVDEQGQLQVVLAHDGGERVEGHACSSSIPSFSR